MTKEEVIEILSRPKSMKGVPAEILTAHSMAIQALKQEPCTDAISRQAAIDAFERFIHELGIKDEPYNYGEMALSPQNVPPVTPTEKVGRWEWKQYDIAFPEIGNYHCSSCDAVGKNGDNYCSVCGAKMREVEE